MKRVFFSAAIIAALLTQACKNSDKKETKSTVTTATETKPAVDTISYLITGQSMGKVKMGMTKAEVSALYTTAKEDTLNMEIEVPALSIYDADGTKLFYATYDEAGKIDGFMTDNTKMATASGIKVGSLYPALKENFKDLEFSNAEGVFASSASANLMFSMEGEITFKMKNDEITNETEKISPEARVTGIYIN